MGKNKNEDKIARAGAKKVMNNQKKVASSKKNGSKAPEVPEMTKSRDFSQEDNTTVVPLSNGKGRRRRRSSSGDERVDDENERNDINLGSNALSAISKALPKTDFDFYVEQIVSFIADERKSKELFAILLRFVDEQDREEYEKIFRFGLVSILRMGAEGLYNLRSTKKDKKGKHKIAKVGSVSAMNMIKYVNMCMLESKKRGDWTKQKDLTQNEQNELIEGVRWVDYAANAYETPKLVGKIMSQNLTNKVNLPVFVLLSIPPPTSDPDGNEDIVLTIRGTEELGDVFTNINAEYCNIPELGEEGGLVHRGMFLCAENVFDRVEPILKDICEKNQRRYESMDREGAGTRITVTGHSLGAATAVILTVLLRLRLQGEFSVSLKCYAFATPACIQQGEALKLARKHVRTFILGDDVVPRVTVQAASQLIRVLTSDSVMATMGPSLVNKLGNTLGLSGAFSQFLKDLAMDIFMDGEEYEAIMASKLIVPGKLYHILPANRKITKDIKKRLADVKTEKKRLEDELKIEEMRKKAAMKDAARQRKVLLLGLKNMHKLPPEDREKEKRRIVKKLKRYGIDLSHSRAEVSKLLKEVSQAEKEDLERLREQFDLKIALQKRIEKREKGDVTLIPKVDPREFDLLPLTPSFISHHFLEEYIDGIDMAARSVLTPEQYEYSQGLHTRVLGAPVLTHRSVKNPSLQEVGGLAPGSMGRPFAPGVDDEGFDSSSSISAGDIASLQDVLDVLDDQFFSSEALDLDYLDDDDGSEDCNDSDNDQQCDNEEEEACYSNEPPSPDLPPPPIPPRPKNRNKPSGLDSPPPAYDD